MHPDLHCHLDFIHGTCRGIQEIQYYRFIFRQLFSIFNALKLRFQTRLKQFFPAIGRLSHRDMIWNWYLQCQPCGISLMNKLSMCSRRWEDENTSEGKLFSCNRFYPVSCGRLPFVVYSMFELSTGVKLWTILFSLELIRKRGFVFIEKHLKRPKRDIVVIHNYKMNKKKRLRSKVTYPRG